MKTVYSSTTKKSTAEATADSAQTAENICRKEEFTIVEETFTSTAKNYTRQETRKYADDTKWKQQPE